jgi:hypothetical protein
MEVVYNSNTHNIKIWDIKINIYFLLLLPPLCLNLYTARKKSIYTHVHMGTLRKKKSQQQ